MADLAKEHFDKQINGVRKDVANLEAKLDHEIGSLRSELRKEASSLRTDLTSYTENQVDRLARIISDVSAADRKHLEAQLQDLKQDLVPPSTVHNLERRITKLERKAI